MIMVRQPTAWAQRHGAAVLTWGLVVVLCWMLARWTWVFLAPAAPLPPVAKRAVIADSIDPILTARLFGGSGAQSGGAEALSTLNLKLRGVFAAGGSAGAAAVINAGQKDSAFKVGGQVLPGVVLEGVFADHVLLRRLGVVERLNLEEKARAANLISTSPAYTLDVEAVGDGRYRLSHKQAGQMLNGRLDGFFGRVSVRPGGGILLQEIPPGSPALKLGLKSGDVIQSLGGTPLRQPGDLAKLAGQFKQAGEIPVEGLRDGKALHLRYTLY